MRTDANRGAARATPDREAVVVARRPTTRGAPGARRRGGLIVLAAALGAAAACRPTPNECRAREPSAAVVAVSADTVVAGARWRAFPHERAGGVLTAVLVRADNLSGAPITIDFGAPPVSVVAFAGTPRPGARPVWDELDGLSVPAVGLQTQLPAGGTWAWVHEIRPAQPDAGCARAPTPPPGTHAAVRLLLFPLRDSGDFRVLLPRDVLLTLAPVSAPR